jgi:hypothetical protein
MLNIRKRNLAKLALGAVYGLAIGTFPAAYAFAPSVEQPVEIVVVQEEVDPLDRFKDARELTETDLKELLQAVGFEGKALRTAWAIAMKESNGRPRAYNGNRSTGDHSYGIFQINMIGSLGEDRRKKFGLKSNEDLFDPVTNAQIAHYMSRGGEDWSSWKVFKGQRNGERFEDFYMKFPAN